MDDLEKDLETGARVTALLNGETIAMPSEEELASLMERMRTVDHGITAKTLHTPSWLNQEKK